MTTRNAEPGARPEIELLLACARTSVDAAGTACIRNLLREDLDWDYLVEISRRHRVTPLLYRSLHSICPEAIPTATLELLRAQYHAVAQHSLFLTGKLLKLLDQLESHGIHAIPLKGPLLAAAAYGNLSLRQFDDLDILIQKQDILRAKAVFIAQGYQPEIQLTGPQEAAFLDSQYEYHFSSADSRVVVGLHYRMSPRYFSFAIAPEHLLNRREQVSLSGKQVWSLSPEDLLLTLCAHGANHCWERLSWICDIAELLRVHQRVHWEQLLERAESLGSERMLLLGLLLAGELLGADLPQKVVQRVRADPMVESLARQVYEQLFREGDDPFGLLKRSLFHLRAREHLQDRVWYCLRLALIPTAEDWALLPLPARLSFIYSLLRPFRLAGTYGLSRLNDLPRLLKRWLARSVRMMLHNRPW